MARISNGPRRVPTLRDAWPQIQTRASGSRTPNVCGLAAAAPVTLKRGEGKIDVSIDSKPFMTYYFNKDVAKPYLIWVRTAPASVPSFTSSN